ncbi:MAG: hypothetical protein ABWX90_00815 [Candidatus Saccharimonadales bacterium]
MDTIEALYSFMDVVFQVIVRTPEAVAIALAIPVLLIVIVLSWRHRKQVRRLNAARRQQDDPNAMERLM